VETVVDVLIVRGPDQCIRKAQQARDTMVGLSYNLPVATTAEMHKYIAVYEKKRAVSSSARPRRSWATRSRTLVRLPDKSSARLMALFFDNLSKGMKKAEALRGAKLKPIAERRDDNASPVRSSEQGCLQTTQGRS
jgi:hypothetical protein